MQFENNFSDKVISLLVSADRMLETADRRGSVKKLFLKISQNSLENTCFEVSFWINLQAWDMQLY